MEAFSRPRVGGVGPCAGRHSTIGLWLRACERNTIAFVDLLRKFAQGPPAGVGCGGSALWPLPMSESLDAFAPVRNAPAGFRIEFDAMSRPANGERARQRATA